jgi:twitching motility protein PilT
MLLLVALRGRAPGGAAAPFGGFSATFRLRLPTGSEDVLPMDLNALLSEAVETGSSDVHLKVGAPPRLRRDGKLCPLGGDRLTENDLREVLDQVTASSPARHDAFLEEGELDIAYMAGSSRFRVNGYRQRGTVAFVFRRIPTEPPTFEQLALPAGVTRLADEQHGLVLVTGPTGSGKSTTLATMIDHVNRTRRNHVVTIEDPIEILHRDRECSVSQREIGLDTRSFSEALRRVLRQDPDVILIGEMRDAETAQTVLHAAESGHLVLSTMHTFNAAETIGRLVEFFPADKQAQIRSILAGVLRGVVSQRLLPKLDVGVAPAVEVMVVNARIADLIRDNRPEEIPQAIADGTYFEMQTFEQALVTLVLEGIVDRDVAANAATNRHDFLVTLDRAQKQEAADRGLAPAEDEEQEREPVAAEAPSGLRVFQPS